MFKKDLLQNKRILITGGGTGLGKEMASHFAEHGADLYICGRRENVLKETADEITKKYGVKVNYQTLDIRASKDVDDYVQSIFDDGPLDGLVNNAAGNFLCPFEDLTPNGWKRINDIVLNGAFNIYHIFGKTFIEKKREAVFLNISTTYSENSSALVIPSAAAKAGVDNIMKGLTVEWSKYGMRFVGIAPGPIADSGGASKLDGAVELAETVFGCDVRLGYPKPMSGAFESINGPENATGAGLLLYALEKYKSKPDDLVKQKSSAPLFQKIQNWFSSNL